MDRLNAEEYWSIFFTFGGFITFVINYCICGFNTPRSSFVDATTSFLLNLLGFEDVVHLKSGQLVSLLKNVNRN